MHDETPTFFLPPGTGTPEQWETWYADLARMCGCSVPSPDKRIYSITYTHDGDVWTATVGKIQQGIRLRVGKHRGRRIERRIPLSDPATTLAIFAGPPCQVVTNEGLGGQTVGSRCVNPFLAGEPTSITYFRVASERQ